MARQGVDVGADVEVSVESGEGADGARRSELLAKFDEIVTELKYLGLTSADLTVRMEGGSRQ